MGRAAEGDWQVSRRGTSVCRARRGDADEEGWMTGSSVDEERMVAERLLAAQLMDLPDTALSGTGLVLQSCKAQVLKTSKSRPILRYIVTCLDREKAAPVRRLIIGKGCYRHDGNKVFGFMRRLWSEGFAEDRSLTIPEPIAYLPEQKLLLQGRAPGKSPLRIHRSPSRGARAGEPYGALAGETAQNQSNRRPRPADGVRRDEASHLQGCPDADLPAVRDAGGEHR